MRKKTRNTKKRQERIEKRKQEALDKEPVPASFVPIPSKDYSVPGLETVLPLLLAAARPRKT